MAFLFYNSIWKIKKKRLYIKPFDLKVAPLIRFKIVIIKDQVIVLIDSHHMICDGSSLNILVQELGRLYSGENLPEIKLLVSYSGRKEGNYGYIY